MKSDRLRRKEVTEPDGRIIVDLVEGAPPTNMGMVGVGAFHWGRGRGEAGEMGVYASQLLWSRKWHMC